MVEDNKYNNSIAVNTILPQWYKRGEGVFVIGGVSRTVSRLLDKYEFKYSSIFCVLDLLGTILCVPAPADESLPICSRKKRKQRLQESLTISGG